MAMAPKHSDHWSSDGYEIYYTYSKHLNPPQEKQRNPGSWVDLPSAHVKSCIGRLELMT